MSNLTCSFSGCAALIRRDNQSGHCRAHRNIKDIIPRTCSFSGCRKTILWSNQSGRCQIHKNANDRTLYYCDFAGCNKILGVYNRSGRCVTHRNLNHFPALPSCTASNSSPSTQQPHDDEPKVDLDVYKKQYLAMDDQYKWTLSTGKVVEDALYDFGVACKHEHLAHQFIVDPFNKQMESIFDEAELQEIRSANVKPMPMMPMPLRNYIASFNKKNTNEIRDVIDTRQPWQINYDIKDYGDYDWVRSSVYNMLREYEAGSFDHSHHETWYLMHVWRFVDCAFDNVPEAEAVRGETSSLASAARKNKDRVIQDRKKIGRKCDIIIRSVDCNHSTSKEYGAGETGSIVDLNGTKMLKESGIKLPKVMRDMFNSLQSRIDHAKLGDLQIVGYLHYGLSCSLLLMDSPACSYVTRLSRYPTANQDGTAHALEISKDVSGFGATFLPALVMAWKAKEVVKAMVELLAHHMEHDPRDSSWLEQGFEQKKRLIMPSCSTSTDARSQKKKNTTHE
ncbi:hypothetical protein G6F43_009372 [Rhizopus delemar]|nr:hypothetical protein G6F43_009372 [Rhizopus delemar]